MLRWQFAPPNFNSNALLRACVRVCLCVCANFVAEGIWRIMIINACTLYDMRHSFKWMSFVDIHQFQFEICTNLSKSSWFHCVQLQVSCGFCLNNIVTMSFVSVSLRSSLIANVCIKHSWFSSFHECTFSLRFCAAHIKWSPFPMHIKIHNITCTPYLCSKTKGQISWDINSFCCWITTN